MSLNSRQVWSILERYYSLRRQWPITSPISQAGGGSHISSAGITPQVAFIIDVGVMLEKLEPQELAAIELAYNVRMASEEAETSAKNADRESRWTSIQDVRKMRQRSKREWRRIANDHRQELHCIRNRQAFKTAMPKLCALLAVIVEERVFSLREAEDAS